MAHGRMRARRVLARLRSMTARVLLRRLLVIGGIALAGWLLGSAGQAHADAGLGSGGGTAAISSLPSDELSVASVKTLARGGAGREAAAVMRPRGLVRGVVASAARHGVIGRVVTVSFGRARSGAAHARTSGHRVVVASGVRSAARHAAAHGRAARSGAAPSAAPAAALGPGRWAHAHPRTAPAIPTPPVELPHRAGGESGALSSAGSAPAGGLAGQPARPVSAPRPSGALNAMVGAVPPAVHTATDEPAISPD